MVPATQVVDAASRLDVLLVDDERNIRTTLGVALEGLGCRVAAAATAEQAQALAAREHFDLAFIDLRLGAANGLDLLPVLLEEQPGLDVVVITAFATVETAVAAIRNGARDYLPKPFSPAQIRHVVDRAREHRRLTGRVTNLESRLAQSTPEIDLETASPRMREVVETARRAAEHEVPILLTGENGTGKSVLARLVHEASARSDGPFVVVNCPTLSDELLASELFGHVRGAFTGAVRDQAGKVEAAENGTLFLDEIGELPAGLQAKLLRFLQEKVYERVGDARTRRANVRLVAATNRNLDAEVRGGRFRQDLLYRLNTVELGVPALRERREDIVPLARRFLAFFSRIAGRAGLSLSEAAERALVAHDWPGNVRELRNAIERAVILSRSDVLGPEAFPMRIATPQAADAGPALGDDLTLEQLEREHIERVVARTPTLDEAARILGIDASTLYRKRKRYETS